MFEFVHMAAELVRLRSNIARLVKDPVRAGIEFVLTIAGLRKEFTLFTMFSGARLFILRGECMACLRMTSSSPDLARGMNR